MRRLILTLTLFVLPLVAACGASVPATPTPAPVNHDTHAWPELEERLPDTISGRDLRKNSLAAHPERQHAKTRDVLRRLGKSVADLQLAEAELAGTDLRIGAMRIVGAEGGAIVDAFRAVDAADPASEATYTDVNLAGKQVTARTVGETSAYLYGTEDIMFIVSGSRALVEAALEQLP